MLRRPELADKGIPSWGLQIKNYLCMMGLNYIWHSGVAGISRNVFDVFKQRVYDIDMQNWLGEINSHTSLRCYIHFKKEICLEPYLIFNENFKYRKLISKLRCCCLEIEVNEGRFNNVPYNRRLCRLCNLKKIEDEYHFLLICPFHSELRHKFIPSYFFQPPAPNKCYSLLRVNNKFLFNQLSFLSFTPWK